MFSRLLLAALAPARYIANVMIVSSANMTSGVSSASSRVLAKLAFGKEGAVGDEGTYRA